VALVTADWHVRKKDRIWPRHPMLEGDIAWGIKQVQQIAARCQVENLLLLGDVFNEQLQQSAAVSQMRAAMQWFQDQNIAVYYVQGQHERAEPPWLAAIHGWPVWIDQQVIELLPDRSCSIYGLDYRHPQDVRAALEAVPRTAQILATHQVWKDFLSADSGDAWFEWVAPHVRTIFTGDYHSHRQMHSAARYILSPGPLCPQKIDESTATGVWLLNDDMTVTSEPLRPRQVFDYIIDSEAALRQFCADWNVSEAKRPQAHVPDSIRKNIIRVHYLTAVAGVRTQITDVVSDAAHIFWDPQNPRQAQETMAEQARLEAVFEQGMPGCIRTGYGDNADVCNAAIRLWNAQNVREEINTIIQEQMHEPGDCDADQLPTTPPT